MSETQQQIQLQLNSDRIEDQIAALQQIASESDVSGVLKRCIELLDAPEDDVRSWVAEALADSVVPTIDDETLLIGCLESIGRSNAPAYNSDAVYWCATMLARLPQRTGVDAERLIDVAGRCARHHANTGAERCLSSAERILAQSPPHRWSVQAEQTLREMEQSEQSSPRLRRLANQLRPD